MLGGKHFIYGSFDSSKYNLYIADFNPSESDDTEIMAPTLLTVKAPKALTAWSAGAYYDNMPTTEFSVFYIENEVRKELTYEMRSIILPELIGKNSFQNFTIKESDMGEFYIGCIFTKVSLITFEGVCYGLKLSAQFNSPYAHALPSSPLCTSFTAVARDGTEDGKPMKYIRSHEQGITDKNKLLSTGFKIINNSNIGNEYIYPTVNFTPVARQAGYGSFISIRNLTDGEMPAKNPNGSYNVTGDSDSQYPYDDQTHRRFYWGAPRLTETGSFGIITVDNNLRSITSSTGKNAAQFLKSKNWLRLKPGENHLLVIAYGIDNLSIKVPCYRMIGF